MSIVTTYTCDRCAKSQTTDDQMWNVKVSYQHIRMSDQDGPKALWCRACMEKVGILGPYRAETKLPDESKPQPLTLEDLVREIARDEVTNMTGVA